MSEEQEQSVFKELQRRNVFRVAIAYILAAWVLLQIADVLFPALALPRWTIRLAAGLLILGFILAVFFAWAFELTPDGLKREKDVARDEATSHTTARRLNIATIIVAIVALALFALDRLTLQTNNGPESAQPALTAPPTDEKSIAVLPFVNMSSDPEQEYFSDGLSEELLNVLARGDEMRVIGRTSSFQFKEKNEDLREIGRRLNVSHILEGSVRRVGNRVRITVQLIDSSDGSNLLSLNFNRTLDDIFAVQEEIANAVADALQVELFGGLTVSDSGYDPEAYDLYLRGLRAQRLPGPENMHRARDYFEQSLKVDPTLAVSWEQLANVLRSMTVAALLPTDEGVALAKEAANRALQLDPERAGVHVAQGAIRMTFDLDWQGAEASFSRALEIDPNNASALSGASLLALGDGDFSGALDLNARSISIDPLNIRTLHNRGFFHYVARDFEKAEAAIRETLDFAGGNYIYAQNVMALIMLEQGRPQEALAANEKELSEPFKLAADILIYFALGRKAESDAALQALIDKYGDRLAVPIAGGYVYRGEHDKAMEWLNTAYAQNDPQLSLIGVHPVNDKIQDDPRFRELLMNLDLL